MSAPRPFRLISTTADVGLVIYGRDLPDLFAHAGSGLFSIMVDLRTVRLGQSYRIRAEASDAEGLLVAWLNQLIYLHEVEGMVARRFDVSHVGRCSVQARGWGEPIDRRRHRLKLAVKAATFHALTMGPKGKGWQARVILDI